MENFQSRLKYFLYLISPGSLIRIRETSKQWSQLLNEQLDSTNDRVIILDGYTALVGNLVVWTENFPYCYGYPYHAFKSALVRETSQTSFTAEDLDHTVNLSYRNVKKFGGRIPDRKTVYRLRQAVEAAKESL